MQIIGYKVTVSAVIERVEKSGKEWVVVGYEEDYPGRDGKPKYGYSPEIEKTVTRETAIYEQRVEDLDMAALVATVNKLQLSR